MKKTVYNFLRKIKHHIVDYKINKKSIKINKKILVIESDDWGSIRTPDRDTLYKLVDLGDDPYSEPCIANDSIESPDDIKALIMLLNQYHDANGKPLVMTLNFVLANANFTEIALTNKYSRETFTDTYMNYFGNLDSLMWIKKGIDYGVIVPQLHCLEHLCVQKWMSDLKCQKKDTVIAFNNKMYGIGLSHNTKNIFGYMDTYNYDQLSDRDYLRFSIEESVRLFEKIFEVKPKSFAASCFIWDDFLESILEKQGIYHIQSGINQIVPRYYDDGKYTKIKHYNGEINKRSQIYTVRNCEFEPMLKDSAEYSIYRCKEQIDYAFQHGYPAIVNSHRANYIDRINPGNREKSLAGLKQVIDYVTKKYPDVIFMSSDELSDYILKKKKI